MADELDFDLDEEELEEVISEADEETESQDSKQDEEVDKKAMLLAENYIWQLASKNPKLAEELRKTLGMESSTTQNSSPAQPQQPASHDLLEVKRQVEQLREAQLQREAAELADKLFNSSEEFSGLDRDSLRMLKNRFLQDYLQNPTRPIELAFDEFRGDFGSLRKAILKQAVQRAKEKKRKRATPESLISSTLKSQAESQKMGAEAFKQGLTKEVVKKVLRQLE